MGVSFHIVPLLLVLLLYLVNCEHEYHYNHQNSHHWNSHDVTSTTEQSETPVVQNATLRENVQEAFKASLALLIGAPIAGIVVLCCCCYCFCKCCAICCCDDKDEGKVIVVQQNNVQPANPQHTQHTVIVQQQQPVYQTPVYGMQPMSPQYGPAPPQQQWAAPPPHYQHQHQHPGAYDNPNYGEPTAPPPQYGQKY